MQEKAEEEEEEEEEKEGKDEEQFGESQRGRAHLRYSHVDICDYSSNTACAEESCLSR